ncbi:MAG: HPr family phosphocarrier protein [Bacillota bacterium]
MRKDFVIANDQGVHARPATTLVKKANEFNSKITLHHENKSVDLKSIMGVLSLGIHRGSLITIEAEGEDAQAALRALTDLINDFNLQ